MKMNKFPTQSSVTEVFKLLQVHPFVSRDRWESLRKDIMLEVVAWRWGKVFIIATKSFTRLTLRSVSLMTYQLHCMVKISVNINPDDDDNWQGVRQQDIMLKCDTTVVFVIRSDWELHTYTCKIRVKRVMAARNRRWEGWKVDQQANECVCGVSRNLRWKIDINFPIFFHVNLPSLTSIHARCRTLHWQLNEDDHQFASSLMLINEGNKCWKINYAREKKLAYLVLCVASQTTRYFVFRSSNLSI